MADYDSSLPIRTESNGDAAVKLVDGSTPSNEASVDSSGRQLTRIENSSGNELNVDADGSIDINLRDEAGASYSSTNPLPVSIEESEGDEVRDYQTSSSVAADASVDHDYSVTAAKTLIGSRAWASASAKMKVEVKRETAPAAGTYDTVYVGFNSTASPNVDIPLDKILKQVATGKIRITLTNYDNQAQDLYSTLTGIEV